MAGSGAGARLLTHIASCGGTVRRSVFRSCAPLPCKSVSRGSLLYRRWSVEPLFLLVKRTALGPGCGSSFELSCSCAVRVCTLLIKHTYECTYYNEPVYRCQHPLVLTQSTLSYVSCSHKTTTLSPCKGAKVRFQVARMPGRRGGRVVPWSQSTTTIRISISAHQNRRPATTTTHRQ